MFLGEVELLEGFGDDSVYVLHVFELAVENQVFLHSQHREEHVNLRAYSDEVRDVLIVREQVHLLVLDVIGNCLSRISLRQASQHIDGGGFTSAIVAKKDENLVLIHGETQVVDHCLVSVLFDNVADDQLADILSLAQCRNLHFAGPHELFLLFLQEGAT